MDRLDFIAKNYNESEGIEGALTYFRNLEILKFINGNNILNIGCGVGTIEKMLTADKNVIGIDGSNDKIEIARSKEYLCKVNFQHEFVENFKSDVKFDTIIMANIVEHLDNPVNVLKKLRNYLKDNGILIISVPNAPAFHKRIALSLGLINNYYQLTEADIEKGHKTNFDKNSLKDIIISSNYNIKELHGFFFKPLPNKYMEKLPDDYFQAYYEIGHNFDDYCSSILAISSKI
jgi:ubiquinone biosynthesis O-methyltransferase